MEKKEQASLYQIVSVVANLDRYVLTAGESCLTERRGFSPENAAEA